MITVKRNGRVASIIGHPLIIDSGADGYSVVYDEKVLGIYEGNYSINVVEAVKGVNFYRALEVYNNLTEMMDKRRVVEVESCE